MEIRDLTDITLSELHDAFMAAFADYVVPIHLTKAQLKSKLKRDAIRFDLSSGAFHNNKLVGFIMHGLGTFYDKLTVYNAGTGVAPKFRGRNLSQELFKHTLPGIKSSGAEQVILEVIRENVAALKVYKKLGFTTSRDLICYQESRKIRQPANKQFHLTKTKKPNYKLLTEMWDWDPSWQNSMEAVERIADNHTFVIATHNGKTVGYAAFIPKTGYISQFAVSPEKRKNQLGTLIFHYMQEKSTKGLILINAFDKDRPTKDFLKNLGFRPFIHQLEMILPI